MIVMRKALQPIFWAVTPAFLSNSSKRNPVPKSLPSLCRAILGLWGSHSHSFHLLLAVAAVAEDTFLQAVQSHEADLLKHVQGGGAQ